MGVYVKGGDAVVLLFVFFFSVISIMRKTIWYRKVLFNLYIVACHLEKLRLKLKAGI